MRGYLLEDNHVEALFRKESIRSPEGSLDSRGMSAMGLHYHAG